MVKRLREEDGVNPASGVAERPRGQLPTVAARAAPEKRLRELETSQPSSGPKRCREMQGFDTARGPVKVLRVLPHDDASRPSRHRQLRESEVTASRVPSPRRRSPKRLREETTDVGRESRVACDGVGLDAVGLSRRGGGSSEATRQKRLKSARVTEQADAIVALPGRTRLETLKVKRPTRQQYLLILWLLGCWAMGASQTVMDGNPNVSLQETLVFLKQHEEDDLVLDDMAAGFLDQIHWEGGHSGHGGGLSSALAWLLPRHQRLGAGCLPRLYQAWKAAQMRAPGGTRLPYPEELVHAVTMVMAELAILRGVPLEVATMTYLCHHCYLRPSELRRLTWGYLVPDQRRPVMVLTLHPAELQASSKSGEYDETVVVDERWLVDLLTMLKQRHRPTDPLLPIGGLEWQKLFGDAQEKLGIVKVLGKQTLYVLRHSGASADAWLRRRSLEEIQRRGRWRAASSTRRYEKGGRISERFNRCSVPIQRYAVKCGALLGRVLSQQCKPLSPP